VQEALNDPLVRKELSMWELVQTCNFMRPNLKFARRLPTTMPLLVMQGDNDRMLKTNAVVELLARTKSTDQTVRWFNGRGHLLLETDYVQPDTMRTMTGWLQEHVRESQPSLTMDSSPHTFISEQVKAEIAPRLAD
jgi:alpha-beta hydrolase superfamily lysophospholipase